MRTEPNNQNANAPLAGDDAAKVEEEFRPSSNRKHRCSDKKTHSAQLRVLVTEWRGQRKIELADFPRVISGVYFQASSGVSLDIKKLPELSDMLKAVRP